MSIDVHKMEEQFKKVRDAAEEHGITGSFDKCIRWAFRRGLISRQEASEMLAFRGRMWSSRKATKHRYKTVRSREAGIEFRNRTCRRN